MELVLRLLARRLLVVVARIALRRSNHRLHPAVQALGTLAIELL